VSEPARALLLDDPRDSQMSLALGLDESGNPGTALIPPS
jgi:hypothetical protein